MLERLLDTMLDLLPAGLADLAFEAMARNLHVVAAVVGTLMLVTALSLAVLLQRREQLVELAVEQRVARREHQPARVAAELSAVVGRPFERGAALAAAPTDDEHDRWDADAQLGAGVLVLRDEDDEGRGPGGRRRWPQDADAHGTAQAQVGALG